MIFERNRRQAQQREYVKYRKKKEDSPGRFFVAAAAEAFPVHAGPTAVTACARDRGPAASTDLFDKIRFTDEGPREGDKVGPSCFDNLFHQSWRPEPAHQTQW